MDAIKIEGIKKKYKNKAVLKDISFEMAEGSCVGILGGNGSGKTTLLSVLAGILRADEGSFYYRGQDLLKDAASRRALVGLIPQTNPLIEELSAWDNLLLWYDKKRLKEELGNGIPALLGIDEFLKKQVSKISGGMKKRLSIACAVANKPRILLMDEPSAALDLVCQDIIHRYITEHKKAGGSVMLVTHDAAELSLCEKHYLLRGGRFEPYLYDYDIPRLASLLQ